MFLCFCFALRDKYTVCVSSLIKKNFNELKTVK